MGNLIFRVFFLDAFGTVIREDTPVNSHSEALALFQQWKQYGAMPMGEDDSIIVPFHCLLTSVVLTPEELEEAGEARDKVEGRTKVDTVPDEELGDLPVGLESDRLQEEDYQAGLVEGPPEEEFSPSWCPETKEAYENGQP